VVATIKDGQTIFAMDGAGAASAPLPTNPAMARMLVALGNHGISGGAGHEAHAHGDAGVPATCMSDGILHLTTAMLGGFAGTEE
jgi:hypothetical protein